MLTTESIILEINVPVKMRDGTVLDADVCDGNVGMYGFYYYGYTQLAAAVAQPPHLKAS
jgi:predicted acyl esterase